MRIRILLLILILSGCDSVDQEESWKDKCRASNWIHPATVTETLLVEPQVSVDGGRTWHNCSDLVPEK